MSLDVINLSLIIIWLIFIWFTKIGMKLTRKLGKYGILSSTALPLFLLSIGFGRPSIYSGVVIVVIGSVIITYFDQRKQKSSGSK
ncbi:hypothetical protein [Companilactobacillus furfuricola]|uniref:hypothetical protein n=1 Tax=Companilactobacillus furfuricola TaxID=1462575 RepID=UPI000F79C30E|nr:hypothetical protein [Companilactobacillus furfuricola]